MLICELADCGTRNILVSLTVILSLVHPFSDSVEKETVMVVAAAIVVVNTLSQRNVIYTHILLNVILIINASSYFFGPHVLSCLTD